MKQLSKLALATTMIVGGAFSTANASEWYYGIGGSQTEIRNLGDFKIKNADVQATGSYDEGLGATFTIGRHIKGPFAIEASYTKVSGHEVQIQGIDSNINYEQFESVLTNNGEIEIDADLEQQLLQAKENGLNQEFTTYIDLDQDIYNVSATYRHQLNNTFYAKAKVGVSYYDLKLKRAEQVNLFGRQDVKDQFKNLNEDQIELVGGVGVGARLSSCCNIEVTYDSTADYQSVQGALVWRF